MADEKKHTGTQGGDHAEHVRAGEQSHKNSTHEEGKKEDAKKSSSPTGLDAKHTGHVLTKDDEKKGGQHSHEKK